MSVTATSNSVADELESRTSIVTEIAIWPCGCNYGITV